VYILTIITTIELITTTFVDFYVSILLNITEGRAAVVLCLCTGSSVLHSWHGKEERDRSDNSGHDFTRHHFLCPTSHVYGQPGRHRNGIYGRVLGATVGSSRG